MNENKILAAAQAMNNWSEPELFIEALTEMWEAWVTHQENDTLEARQRSDMLLLYRKIKSFLESLN